MATSHEANAKLTRREQHCPRSSGVSESSISTSSREPCAFDGFGSNGRLQRKPGRGQRYPATTLTVSSLQTAHKSPWETAKSPASGDPAGYKEKGQGILRLFYSPRQREKSDRSLQLWKITTGCEILTFGTDSPRSSSHSSLHCGTLLPQRSSTRNKRTRLGGHKRRTVNTPRPRPTKLNSKSASLRPS
jgi:hypothetical protein